MLFLVPILVSLLFLGYGAHVLVVRGVNRVTASFFALCALTFCWQFIWSLLVSAGNTVQATMLARLGYTLILFLPTSLYYFVVELTRMRGELRWVAASAVLACALAVLLPRTDLVVAGVWHYAYGYYPRAGVLHPLHLLATAAVVLRALEILWRQMRRALSTERLRLRYCFASVLIYSMAAVDYVCNYGVPIYPPGVLFVALSLGLIAQAIARHHLLANPMLLAATLAHELRTPLATIRGQARVLSRGLPALIATYERALAAGEEAGAIAPHQLAYLRELGCAIENEVRRSNFIAEIVLANARGGELDTQEFALYSVRACVTEALNCYPFDGGMQQRVRLGRQEDFTFYGSSALLVFVLYNLIKNALSAIHGSGGVIEIGFWEEQESKRLVVKDTGRGIAPHVLPHVFDPFFTTSSTGTGMGLAFCRNVVTAFGGTIACHSREGEFTEVSLNLPAAREGLAA